jgi:hypothetical protein
MEPQAPLGSSFTYQGQLSDGGVPATGPCDFRFVLYDAQIGGSQVGPIQERAHVELSEGRFGVNLDFGASAFTGQARWLEVAVQCAADANYTTLGRVALTAAPQALQSLQALDADQLDGQHASAFASASHDHLGQTWTGSDNPLKMEGSYGWPYYAPLVITSTHEYGRGVYVIEAGGDAFSVGITGGDGLHMYRTFGDGVDVEQTFGDGFRVCMTGGETSCSSDNENHGLEVGNAQHDGVHVIEAGDDGLSVDTAGNNGLLVQYAGGNGLRVNGAGLNGVEIWDTTYDGVQVNNAGRDGVRADTSNANQEWGFRTEDKGYAGAGWTASGPLTFVAQNGDAGELKPGDVVAAIGLAKPFADSPDPVPLVGRASAESGSGIIGVVLSRFVAEQEVEEIEAASGEARQTRFHTHSAEGPVEPGDHLLIVVLGVAQVRVAPGAEVQAGLRLTASDLAGHVRALHTETLNGMQVSEGAPVVGVALATPGPGETTVPVFVTLR